MTLMRVRTLASVGIALVLVAAVAACGSSDKKSSKTTSVPSGQPGKGKPPVTIGDKNFTEQYILGDLYKQALEAKGFTVKLKGNIGSSEITDKALTSGKIDMYPEYTGVIVQELAHDNSKPKSADETYTKAKAFQEKRGFTLLDKSPGFDADVNVTTPKYAQKNGIKTTADLKKVPGFKFGAPPENKTRFQGAVGMKQVYGLDFKFVPLAIGLRYQALDSGKIDVAAVFTTEGQLADKNKYTILSDPKGIFGFQNITPVINTKKLDAMGPEFQETVNAVTSKLTNEALQKMNGAVDLDKQKPAEVAKQFLEANGLLSGS
jgi:osmoprotectant transport system substrate-binding protein